MVSLDLLEVGQSGRILRLDFKASEGQRFAEMGLTAGATLKVLKLAPLGDPMEILVRGYHLSLRKSDARLIEIEPLE